MNDDTVTIPVGMYLGAASCHLHPCQQCRMPIDETAVHGLSCRKSQGYHPLHHMINDIICTLLTTTGVPCQLEPHCLSRSDGKRPDGVTLLPWRNGRPLIWDVTRSDTSAPSYSSLASNRTGGVADQAEVHKAVQPSQIQPYFCSYLH